MKRSEFDSFFSQYSKNVDNAERQGFWKLSDSIVERILCKYIKELSKDSLIVDAGGGTARWAIRLSEHCASNFLVYDKSPDMLIQAKQNVADHKLTNRISLLEGDLEKIDDIKEGSVDFIYSTYGVISFLENVPQAFSELFRILKPGGRLLVMGHGLANAIASKINSCGVTPDNLVAMHETDTVKWAPHVPALRIFSKESLESYLSQVGFTNEAQFGVPLFIQPGPEDFDPTNQSISKVSASLSDPQYMQAVMDIEMEHFSEPTMVNRGVNVIAVARK